MQAVSSWRKLLAQSFTAHMSLPKLNLITNTQNRIREHISLCTRVPHTIQHRTDFTFSLFIVQSVAHCTKAGIVFSCNVMTVFNSIYHQRSIYDHNLTYSQANYSISMPMDACNSFFVHIMATGNTETITEYRTWHIQQVCIQLPTYTNNVAPKNLLLVITSATPTAVPNLVQIRPRGLLGKWVKYNKFFFIYLYFFSSTHLQVRPADGFSRLMAQTTRIRARMCLLGVSLTLLPIWG